MKEGSLPTKVSDKIKKLKHEPKTDVEKDFMKHHTTSMGADKMGRLSEPDTYDWDDDDEEIGGYQKEWDLYNKGRGYPNPIPRQEIFLGTDYRVRENMFMEVKIIRLVRYIFFHVSI